MKLRLLGNSIRIRIQQQELEALEKHGLIEEHVHFGPAPGQKLTYSLEVSNQLSEVDAGLDGQRISVYIPTEIIKEMVQTDRVSAKTQKPLDKNEMLTILVEKDFKCLTPRVEDADAFPHPDQGHHG